MSQTRTSGPPSAASYKQSTRTVSTEVNTKYALPVDTKCPLGDVVALLFGGLPSLEQKTSRLTVVIKDSCGIAEPNGASATGSWHYRCKEWSALVVCLFGELLKVQMFRGFAFLIDLNSLLKVS